MMNIEAIRKIVTKYCGDHTERSYSEMWDALREHGIIGLCMGGREEKIDDITVRRTDEFMDKDGRPTGIYLHRLIVKYDCCKNYTQYIG